VGLAEGRGRILVLVAAVAVIVVVLLVLALGGSSYTVHARFVSASQIVTGNAVKVSGTTVGSVKDIELTDDGQAEITLSIDGDGYHPLRRGTRAIIREASLSGVANRYVDLQLGPATGADIPDGGTLSTDETQAAVDLDQIFNTFDPQTRKGVQKSVEFLRDFQAGNEDEANEALRYLNPALSGTARLFAELNRNTPDFERFIVQTSKLVTDVSSQDDALTDLVRNLGTTTSALTSNGDSLAQAVGLLPTVMRKSNSTFVNLRAALDDVDPLVDASKPVAARLQPFLAQARGFAADAKPTVRDLRTTVHKAGTNNDLIDLINTVPRLADIAVDSKKRDGKVRRGAFPETVDAFKGGAPIIAQARPYTQDFLGWMDDFSTTGGGFDAMGAYARAQLSFAENLGGPIKEKQYKRCPGASEEAASDGSNVASTSEASALDCDRNSRATGNVGP
jgi:phospholipid/cholesterol/gamma-HCH transport system substrate-binding protein